MKAIASTQAHRYKLTLCTLLLLVIESARPQVNLNTENLNATLKEVQRAHLTLNDASDEDMKPELLFQLGSEADKMAMRLTRHSIEYGDTEKGLIDLILKRINELNIIIQWFPEKERYFYDGAAFLLYLQLAPDGLRAAESAYQLLEIGFFKLSGDNLETLQASVKQKQDFLARYPDERTAAKVRIMLAIEYRDISRINLSKRDTEQAKRFIDQARDEARQVINSNPGTQEARTAQDLLDRIADEFQTLLDAEK